MTEGQVMLAPLPQADGRKKRRPVLLLRQMPPCGDLLVCGISTQLHMEVAGFDELLKKGDPDFSASGVLTDSLVRLGFLALLPRTAVEGAIGTIAPTRHERLLNNLARYLLAGSQGTAD